MPRGRYRDLAHYSSIRALYPGTYGIGPGGMPADAQPLRRAQARQLQGYLLVFEQLLADYDRWEKIYNEWRKKNPDKAKMLDDGIERKIPADLLSRIPEFPKDAKLATRKAGGEVLQPIAREMPLLMSGSADLHGSTMNYIKEGEDFTRDNPSGRNSLALASRWLMFPALP